MQLSEEVGSQTRQAVEGNIGTVSPHNSELTLGSGIQGRSTLSLSILDLTSQAYRPGPLRAHQPCPPVVSRTLSPEHSDLEKERLTDVLKETHPLKCSAKPTARNPPFASIHLTTSICAGLLTTCQMPMIFPLLPGEVFGAAQPTPAS